MSITTTDLKNHLDQGTPMTLIEALPAQHFEAEHLPGAINIPHDEIDQHLDELPDDKGSLIATYCASKTCQNSGLAADTLKAYGYTNVVEYVDGKEGWHEAGLPFEQNANASD